MPLMLPVFVIVIIVCLVFNRPIGWLLDRLATHKGWTEQPDYNEPTRGIGAFGKNIGPPKRRGFWLWAGTWLLLYALACYYLSLAYPAYFVACPTVGLILLLLAIFPMGKLLGLLGEVYE